MTFALALIVSSIAAIIIISLYGIAVRPNLVKKIICLGIFSDIINVAVILLGYRAVKNPLPPVLTDYSQKGVEELVRGAVDPLPQALTITAIVIGLAITVLMAYGAIHIQRKYGTVDVRKLVRWEE